jgi:hypothetical protein
MGLERLLFFFGLGFLLADARAVVNHLRYWRRRPGALLTWPAPYPPFFSLQLILGGLLGLLLSYNLLFREAPAEELFGEGMMFLYYSYAVPLAHRIDRGLYEQGVWTDLGFVRYGAIGAVSWREEEEPVLLLASRSGGTARRLRVPGPLYGQTRRILRDLARAGRIDLAAGGLGLGEKDAREDL